MSGRGEEGPPDYPIREVRFTGRPYSHGAVCDAIASARAAIALAPMSRERSIVETKLDEAELWAARVRGDRA